MEKKQMLTGLYFIPKSNDSWNAFGVVDRIVQQLGYLNCEAQNDEAVIKYNGILSQDIKTKLTNLADDHDFIIIYIEAEYETPFANDNTIHIPTNEEMIIHLEDENYFKEEEEKVNHP